MVLMDRNQKKGWYNAIYDGNDYEILELFRWQEFWTN